MSLDLETVPDTAVQGDLLEAAASPLTISLQDFVSEFGDELLDSLNRANPPVYAGQARAHRQTILAGLKRKLFPAQAEVVHAVTELLVDRGERAAIVNGEMGCGKTTVGIATAAVLNAEGYRRTLVLSPPHLVYKWRREIQETVAGAKVWVLNGPDTLVKLLKLREQLGVPPQGQEFFVLGRVRMRMGFHWKPVSCVGVPVTATWGRARIAAMSSPTWTASRSTRWNSKRRKPAASADTAPRRCGR